MSFVTYFPYEKVILSSNMELLSDVLFTIYRFDRMFSYCLFSLIKYYSEKKWQFLAKYFFFGGKPSFFSNNRKVLQVQSNICSKIKQKKTQK